MEGPIKAAKKMSLKSRSNVAFIWEILRMSWCIFKNYFILTINILRESSIFKFDFALPKYDIVWKPLIIFLLINFGVG